jgi:shikimate kinase
MRLSLIGMSGCGKSHWSKEFAEHGFERFCCDDLITEKLTAVLARPDGTIMELGEWMGLPYESHYENREATYLAYEREVLMEICQHLESEDDNTDKNVIVDTTGSVIYTGHNLLKRLGKATTIVHLETPPDVLELMLEKYLTNQRPVLWRGLFSQKAEETNDQALARCYPALLSAREQQYAKLADVTVPYGTVNQDSFTIEDFIAMVAPPVPESPSVSGGDLCGP